WRSMTSSPSRSLPILIFSALTVAFVPPCGAGARTTSAGTLPQLPCSYTLSTTSQSFSRSGGPGTFTVTANCDWSAMSTVTWITVDPSRQDDTATLSYFVGRNDGDTPRTGSIQILAVQGGIVGTINVSQETGCRFRISPSGAHLTAVGGS